MNDMYSESRTLTEQWLLAEFEGEDLKDRADQDALKSEQADKFWPFLSEYYSPYNPVFSPVYRSYLQSQREPTVWLRDGIIPLTWLFRQNQPKDIAGSLLLNERLARYVPEEWRAKVSLYRLHARPVKNPATLLIAGPVSERVCGLEELEEQLDLAIEAIGRRKLSVKLFCPIRGDGEKFPAEFYRRVYARFPSVEVIDWHWLVNARSLEDVLYMELNGLWIYADSFVQQHVLSCGAGLLFDKAPAKSSRLLPLSRFHSAEVSPLGKAKFVNWDDAAFKYCRQVAELNGKAVEEGLWPSWYESGCHALK